MPGKLAGIIRSKYPGAYDDMDDATLEQSVLAKYPQYADLAKDDPPASQATPLGAMMAQRGGTNVTSDAPTKEPSLLASMGDAMFESAARPQTGLDFVSLVGAPMDATRSIGTKLAGRIASALPVRTIANKALKATSAVLDSPLANVISPRLQHLGKIANGLAETIGTTAAAAAPEAEAVAAQAVNLAQPAKAGSLTQEQIAARVAAVKANGGLPAVAQPTPVRGVVRTAPTAPAQEAIPKAWKPFAESAPRPQDALRQPRVEIGAERVGRTAGMTKEAVRQQTGPIVGEELGEASPILPSDPLKRIIDTMKAIPPAEREAYVAKATAGKSRGQVENIRRTLEHLGLLVAAPVVGATAREALIAKMSGASQ